MPSTEDSDSVHHETGPCPKPQEEKNAVISRREFLGGIAASAAAATIGLPWPLETNNPTAAQDDIEGEEDVALEIGPTTGAERADQALGTRLRAARYEREQPLPGHPDNGDEALYPNRIASYSKGLPHNDLGEVDLTAYSSLIRALSTGRPDDFEAIPLGGVVRLVDPQAALAFELVGPDSHQLSMPPPPAFASAEMAAEMAEIYWQALARDIPFSQYESTRLAQDAAADLSRFPDFRGPRVGGRVTAKSLFRTGLPGDLVGHYVSQFLLASIPFGPMPVDQRMRTAAANIDFLTGYVDWLAAQNGAAPATDNVFDQALRYIRNGRDLGEWVHRDWPYQSGLIASLILLGLGVPFQQDRQLLPGSLILPHSGLPLSVENPYSISRTQTGFATFGAPDILDAVASVGNRALKAVWYQKWLVHRRLRPEAFAGRIHNLLTRRAVYPIHGDILQSPVLGTVLSRYGTYLLPLAYPEGSPAHPAYPSGHAAFAGACATILKAFFEESFVIPDPVVVSDDGRSLLPFDGPDLTVGGELNKLASNIACGRCFAGIHFRSSAIEGLKLGEEVAIRFLAERALTYHESFAGFKLTRFDGTSIVVGAPPIPAAQPSTPLEVHARVSIADGTRVVDISITNKSAGAVTQLEVRGAIPAGARLVSAAPAPYEIQGNEIVWFHMPAMGEGQTLSGFQYRFSGGVRNPFVTVNFIGKTRGNVSTDRTR